MSVSWKTWAGVLVILCGGAMASAGTTLTLTFLNDSPRLTGTIVDTGSSPGYNGAVYVGQSNFSLSLTQDVDSGSSAEGLQNLVKEFYPEGTTTGTIYAYCIDTYDLISNNHTDTWEVVDLNADPTAAPTVGNATKVQLLKRLFNDFGDIAHTGGQEYAAAMAACVWEVVNEGQTTMPYSISGGDFKVTGMTSLATGVANGWLDGLTPLDDGKPMYAMVDDTTQDFVIPIAGVSASTVPEPLTMASAFSVIGGLGMYIRRRSGKSMRTA